MNHRLTRLWRRLFLSTGNLGGNTWSGTCAQSSVTRSLGAARTHKTREMECRTAGEEQQLATPPPRGARGRDPAQSCDPAALFLHEVNGEEAQSSSLNWDAPSLDSHLLPRPVQSRKIRLAFAGCALLKKTKKPLSAAKPCVASCSLPCLKMQKILRARL